MIDSGWRKRQIADEIHSCSPFCDKPMCVAEAVQAEREACAGLCDRFANRMMTAEECADAIRARGQPICTHEWIDATKTKPQWHCAKCGVEYKKEKA